MNYLNRMGVLGGTFDPVHYGHLFIADCALHEFALDKIIFMPAACPPHKNEKGVLSSKHRVNMLRLALENESNYLLSTIEIEREGYSYTIDTLRYLIKQNPDTEFYFIMGLDAFIDLPNWKEPQDLLQLCKFIIFNRPFSGTPNVGFSPNETLNFGERVYFLSFPGIFISSSLIRARLKESKTVQHMLPRKVFDYIKDNGLYLPKKA